MKATEKAALAQGFLLRLGLRVGGSMEKVGGCGRLDSARFNNRFAEITPGYLVLYETTLLIYTEIIRILYVGLTITPKRTTPKF